MQRLCHRVAAETMEQRAARLQQMSSTQRETRAAESSQLTRCSREEPFKQRSGWQWPWVHVVGSRVELGVCLSR